jgi:hypothetical protein
MIVDLLIETKEGYDLRTVGSRFFEDSDAFLMGKAAMSFLDTIQEEI